MFSALIALSALLPAQGTKCPGAFTLGGDGDADTDMELVNARWNVPGQEGGKVELRGGRVIPHLTGRTYFATKCKEAGPFNNKEYAAINFLGKTMKYTIDLSGAGCGCNAALYLTSMYQNDRPSGCMDHYCDANNVCGESCAEIDIQEANMQSWHSTLHTWNDHSGLGGGYGGGSGPTSGPRNWLAAQYGPGADCIDTSKPFQVAVSFPVNGQGALAAMDVVLSQAGKSCPLSIHIGEYGGMGDLSTALQAGMTPIISYWASNDMLWMDGKGPDGLGPCAVDNAAACAESVEFSNFSLVDLEAPGAKAEPEHPKAVKKPVCPGSLKVRGREPVSITPAGWFASEGAAAVDVTGGNGTVAPHLGSRAYFAEACEAGVYDHEHYVALGLLGKTLKYTVDLSGAGCGCKAALYLTSLRQNDRPSECSDYYCDAGSVCGEACAEIDIQEANQQAWHSTLHTAGDPAGVGAGTGGGGADWNGPRDWASDQFGPGASCIDTSLPFQVAASFPVDDQGQLAGMEVTLTQEGKSCPLKLSLAKYVGMADLTSALRQGMTPVVSYVASDKMSWMDGVGQDGKGPCQVDTPEQCPESVKFSGFSVEKIDKGAPGKKKKAPVAATCPGKIAVGVHEQVSIVPAGWQDPDDGGAHVETFNTDEVILHLGGRAYFADSCTAGNYDNRHYIAPNLLGKTLRYKVDFSGAGCGCNAAFYLTSMRQNKNPSECTDYYCDANNVCGESCAEIDIQEANELSWHSTLHTSGDGAGKGAGYGGGGGSWNGPRDWTPTSYGRGAGCIDTTMPIDVAVSFPVDAAGALAAMNVTLSQEGHSCELPLRLDSYAGMAELSEALAAGMTPIVSYWASEDMLWMDGQGVDGKGPCPTDSPSSCADSIKFYRFSLTNIGEPAPVITTMPTTTTTSTPVPVAVPGGASLVVLQATGASLAAALLALATGGFLLWRAFMKRQASSAAAGPAPPLGAPGPVVGALQSTASSQRLLGMEAA